MHSLYWRHLIEIAEGSCNTIAIKQNLCHLLRSTCLYKTVSHCIEILTLQLFWCHYQHNCHPLFWYTHTPAAYSNVTTNTTVSPCVGILHPCLVLMIAFMRTMQVCHWITQLVRLWMHTSHEKLAVASFWKSGRKFCVYPQTSHIPTITLGGYYHDVIKQQVNNSDKLRKWLSNI